MTTYDERIELLDNIVCRFGRTKDVTEVAHDLAKLATSIRHKPESTEQHELFCDVVRILANEMEKNEPEVHLVHKNDRPIDLAVVNKMEDDLKDMHLSRMYMSTNMVTGQVSVEAIELKSRDENNTVMLVQDKSHKVRIYPTSDKGPGRQPLTVQTWNDYYVDNGDDEDGCPETDD